FLAKQVEQIESTASLRRDLKVLYLEYLWREEEYLKKREVEIANLKIKPINALAEVKVKLQDLRQVLEAPTEKLKLKSELVAKIKQELLICRGTKDRLFRQ